MAVETLTEHCELVRVADQWLKQMGCNLTFPELHVATCSGEIPDAIGWRDGGKTSILVECKVSRADFLADAQKPFRKSSDDGMGNWRFYLCPEGLIGIDELPAGWGLLYVTRRGVRKVHGVPGTPMLRASWMDHPFRASKHSESVMLVAALRRLQIRGYLPLVYAGLPSVGDSPEGADFVI
jgi:hypothetical protein